MTIKWTTTYPVFGTKQYRTAIWLKDGRKFLGFGSSPFISSVNASRAAGL